MTQTSLSYVDVMTDDSKMPIRVVVVAHTSVKCHVHYVQTGTTFSCIRCIID